MKRAHYIGAPGFFRLNEACRIVNEAFSDSYGCYLVGSSLVKRDYRDVDVRLIMPDEDFERLFPGCGDTSWRHPTWSLICSSVSLYLAQVSGLPIDFQIQSMTEANRDYAPPEHPRYALGLFWPWKPREKEKRAEVEAAQIGQSIDATTEPNGAAQKETAEK